MQGHEEAHIEQWEDPSFDIYHTTDRYGFIQYVTPLTLQRAEIPTGYILPSTSNLHF